VDDKELLGNDPVKQQCCDPTSLPRFSDRHYRGVFSRDVLMLLCGLHHFWIVAMQWLSTHTNNGDDNVFCVVGAVVMSRVRSQFQRVVTVVTTE
jgi:hypothetical protein